MAYDALFKELLRSFFREFLERFFPEQAARLDFSQVVFLEKELATDVGSGRQRTLDLIAQVRAKSGAAELVLIHVEFEARYEPEFAPEMFNDYTLLRRRHRIPVLPIVVYITGGRGEDQWEVYRDLWLGETIAFLRFLSRCREFYVAFGQIWGTLSPNSTTCYHLRYGNRCLLNQGHRREYRSGGRRPPNGRSRLSNSSFARRRITLWSSMRSPEWTATFSCPSICLNCRARRTCNNFWKRECARWATHEPESGQIPEAIWDIRN